MMWVGGDTQYHLTQSPVHKVKPEAVEDYRKAA